MDFKAKAKIMIDSMKDEQVICLVNFLDAFVNSDDQLASTTNNTVIIQKSESEEVTLPSEKKITAIYGVEDIIRILGISRSSAYSLMKTNPFPIVRVGKIIRIPKEPFEEWMISQNS